MMMTLTVTPNSPVTAMCEKVDILGTAPARVNMTRSTMYDSITEEDRRETVWVERHTVLTRNEWVQLSAKGPKPVRSLFIRRSAKAQ